MKEKINTIQQNVKLRTARVEEFIIIGKLLTEVYAGLKGFPGAEEQPAYYTMLRNVGALTEKPGTEIIVALTPEEEIVGAVVYFDNIQYYGSGGSATNEKEAVGFRLLAVKAEARGSGIGKMLTEACIQKARQAGHSQLIIHTTKAMQLAWMMYEKSGFRRAVDLDFLQGNMEVFGFRLPLTVTHDNRSH